MKRWTLGLLTLISIVQPALADHYYLRPVGDSAHFSDAADYTSAVDTSHPPDGMEWIAGKPPGSAAAYLPPTTLEKLHAVFVTLPVEQQAAFGPLAASVLMFLQQNNPTAAKLVIQDAQIPAELESVRAQMLEAF